MARWLPPAFRADWRHPLLFSWRIDAAALEPFVPDGLELDRWEGSAYISLVGLRMESVRLFGVPSPLGGYDEVNLRFYVRRKLGDHCSRGVVFLRQSVPHRTTAVAARLWYGEPFAAVPTGHSFSKAQLPAGEAGHRIEYWWGHGDRNCSMWAEAGNPCGLPEGGSLEEFLTARRWGYNGKPGRRTRTYRLCRPVWSVAAATDCGIELGDAMHRGPIDDAVRNQPAAALLASGSRAELGLPGRLQVV